MFGLFSKSWSNKPINRSKIPLKEKLPYYRQSTHKNEKPIGDNNAGLNMDKSNSIDSKTPIKSDNDLDFSTNKSNLLPVEKPPKSNNDYSNLDSIDNLEDFYSYLNNFRGCALREGAKNTVTHSGPLDSPVCLIGEAPGAEEDLLGKPFVGRSGQLIRKMFIEAGINPDKLYITNTVNWRPPENRTPTQLEIDICKPLLHKHLELKKSPIVVCLGATAMRALLGLEQITKVRGQIIDLTNNMGKYALVTFHPSYVLRLPKQASLVQKDLETLRKKLESCGLYSAVAI